MKEKSNKGVIYILTNPSFPDYVKIGYADDVDRRLKELNRSECIPFAFRLYAYYEVNERLTDTKLHSMIDSLNPALRSTDELGGKKRIREFYAMPAHNAYAILETIATLSNTKNNLHIVEPSEQDIKDEEEATGIRTRVSPTKLPKMDWLIKEGLVHIGDKIYVTVHPSELATIKDDKHVIYNGETLSFNQFGCKVTGWKSIQCYAWMKVEGKDETLAEMRERKMKEEKKKE